MNGERITGRRALTNHDALKIGKCKMLFTVRGTPGTSRPAKGTNCMACGGAIAPRETIEGLTGLVRHVAEQLFDAVGAIHAADMIHRDIKPANILRLDQDRIKLIDSGLAKSTGKEPWSVITATGAGLGTMQYVAPEQYSRGSEVDCRADIYGLGATFYHLLCGRPPIIAETEIDFYHAMKDFSIPPAAEVEPSIAPAVGAWVMRALARDPGERYGDVEEFRKAFQSAYKIS